MRKRPIRTPFAAPTRIPSIEFRHGPKTQTVIEHDACGDHAHQTYDRALRKVKAAHQNWKRLSGGQDQERRALNENVCEV